MSTSSLPSFIKIHLAVLEKKSKMWKVYARLTDDGRCAMTIAHSSLRLRWAKKTWKYTVFRCFLLHALTNWAEILHVTFVLLYYRSSLSVVNFRRFLWELCPCWNLEYWKYTVFRTFLLHALTYWAEILHMTLFYCSTDQVRVSSIRINYCRSYAPFGT